MPFELPQVLVVQQKFRGGRDRDQGERNMRPHDGFRRCRILENIGVVNVERSARTKGERRALRLAAEKNHALNFLCALWMKPKERREICERSKRDIGNGFFF